MRTLLIVLGIVGGLALGAAAQQSNVTNAVVIAALQAMGLFGDGYANGEVPIWSAAGGQFQPGAGGGGAPDDATYVTQTPNVTLTSEQALSTLATGLMRSTTATGVVDTITSSTVGQVLRVTAANTFAFGALDLADGDAITGLLPNANLTYPLFAPDTPTDCSAPQYAFTGDTDTGIGYGGANIVGIGAGGAPCRVTVSASSVTSTVPILMPAGTVLDPGLADSTTPTTGWFTRTPGEWNFTVASTERVRLTANGIDVGSRIIRAATIQLGTAFETVDVSLSREAADVLALASGDSFNLVGGGGSYRINNIVTISSTAPSAPVACTTPTVVWSNGTAAFQIDVGSTCAGVTTLAVTMPAATNAWQCVATNVTTSATAAVEMTASTSTSITLTNYTRTTGVALDWADGADVRIACWGG